LCGGNPGRAETYHLFFASESELRYAIRCTPCYMTRHTHAPCYIYPVAQKASPPEAGKSVHVTNVRPLRQMPFLTPVVVFPCPPYFRRPTLCRWPAFREAALPVDRQALCPRCACPGDDHIRFEGQVGRSAARPSTSCSRTARPAEGLVTRRAMSAGGHCVQRPPCRMLFGEQANPTWVAWRPRLPGPPIVPQEILGESHSNTMQHYALGCQGRK
jgi:hypothetical protein